MSTEDRPRLRRYYTPYAGWVWATFGRPKAKKPCIMTLDFRTLCAVTARKFPLTRWVK